MWEHVLFSRESRITRIKRKTDGGIRRGWVPQPVGRGNPAPTIADISVTGDSPEGRHVYSTRHVQISLAPEGRHVYSTAACAFV